MKKIYMVFTVMYMMVIILVGCTAEDEVVKAEYLMSNGKTPTETKEILIDSLLDIYMPMSEDDIQDGIDNMCKIATEDEIEVLKNEVGKFDENLSAVVKNLNVSIATGAYK